MNAEQREGAVTIMTFIEAPSRRAGRAGVLLTLTLAAGWTDALCYLILDRVFASFMTGNLLFVGLSLAQRNTALLLRAGVAAVLLLSALPPRRPHLPAPPS